MNCLMTFIWDFAPQTLVLVQIIILIKICNAPTLRLKALNKHRITHVMYIEMENVINNKNVYKKKEKANA